MEFMWPIIFLIPETGLNDWPMVVATYCPALAWQNARPWTASSSRIFQLPFVGNIWPLPMGGPFPARVIFMGGPLLVPVAVNCNEPDLEEDLEAGSCATGTTVTVPSSLSVPVAVKSNKPDFEED